MTRFRDVLIAAYIVLAGFELQSLISLRSHLVDKSDIWWFQAVFVIPIVVALAMLVARLLGKNVFPYLIVATLLSLNETVGYVQTLFSDSVLMHRHLNGIVSLVVTAASLAYLGIRYFPRKQLI